MQRRPPMSVRGLLVGTGLCLAKILNHLELAPFSCPMQRRFLIIAVDGLLVGTGLCLAEVLDHRELAHLGRNMQRRVPIAVGGLLVGSEPLAQTADLIKVAPL